MELTFKSTKFLKQLKDMQAAFAAKPRIAARIRVPESMIWWYWNEFGTASFSEKPTTKGAGYVIPLEADFVAFPDMRTGSGETVVRKEVWHKGIAPRHMVLNVEPEIMQAVVEEMRDVLHDTHYDPEAIANRLKLQIMPRVKDIIRQSFEQSLQLPDEYGVRTDIENAKLHGAKAADIFDIEATIELVD